MVRTLRFGYIFVFVLFVQGIVLAQPKDDPNPERFKKQVATFQQWDLKNSFPEDAILFIGSSSIRFWETHKAFPGLSVINRGFGGSHISDIQHYYEQVVGKYSPSIIVFYAGDNDIAAGKPQSQVFRDYKELADKVLVDFPKAKFVYIPIKPSESRWNHWDAMQEVNLKIKEYNKEQDRLFYVDLATPLLAKNDKPIDRYYVEDQLHLSEAGYQLWNSIMSKKLDLLMSENAQND